MFITSGNSRGNGLRSECRRGVTVIRGLVVLLLLEGKVPRTRGFRAIHELHDDSFRKPLCEVLSVVYEQELRVQAPWLERLKYIGEQ